MVKALFCGDVDDTTWELLVVRLEELNRSAHGPFEVLFLTSPLVVGDTLVQSTAERLLALDMKIYAFTSGGNRGSTLLLPPCFEVFSDGIGLVNGVKNLTIAYHFLDDHVDSSETMYGIQALVSGTGYRGCDVLICSKFPKDVHQFLASSDELHSTVGAGSGSRSVSDLAMMVRPRYLFASGIGRFYQRVPYVNDSVNELPRLFTRLIVMDVVSTSKEKDKKWMHALGINPIIYMKRAEIEEAPAEFTECPFASSLTHSGARGVSDNAPSAKRMKFGGDPRDHGQVNSIFFDSGGAPAVKLNLVAPLDAKSLFVGGLPRDASEQDLRRLFTNVTAVRRPAGKSFAFVEFMDHESARRALDSGHRGNGVILHQRKLQIGWSEQSSSQQPSQGSHELSKFDLEHAMRERQLIPPSEDAHTLFIGNVQQLQNIEQQLQEAFPGITSVRRIPNRTTFVFAECDSYSSAMAIVSKSIHEPVVIQGQPLVIGWSTPTSSLALPQQPADCKVLFLGNLSVDTSSHDVESLCVEALPSDCKKHLVSVRRPEGRDYAFVEFSRADSAFACASQLVTQESSLHGMRVRVGWAVGRPADRLNQSADCWFCLASPTIKEHLIVSVAEHNYLAIPRGGIADLHVILCPIDCVPSRVHLSAEAKSELQQFSKGIHNMFMDGKNAVLSFERAIRTKSSRDHVQVHFIPVPLSRISNSLQIFEDLCVKHNLSFVDIREDQSVEEAVLTMEGGPYQEYFYLELPVSVDQDGAVRTVHKVFVQDPNSARFPMFFGNELAAQILGRPERANWKNCVRTEKEEAVQVEDIREKFAPFDIGA